MEKDYKKARREQVAAELVCKDTEYYIWGAYWMGAEVCKIYQKDLNIVGFLDINPSRAEETFCDLPIFLPEVLDEKDSRHTKVIVAYHSSSTLQKNLEYFGFLKHQAWFEYRDFQVQYHYAKNKTLHSNRLFFSLKGQQPEKSFLSADEILEHLSSYFDCIDSVSYLVLLEDDWWNYPELEPLLETMHTKGFLEKVTHFFFKADKTSQISEKQLSLLSQYGITLRLSNYKQVGCDTEPFLPLIERILAHKISYFLIFSQNQNDYYRNIPRIYDYPEEGARDVLAQYFASTCDGDVRIFLEKKTLYVEKSLDRCSYGGGTHRRQLQSFPLTQREDKETLFCFLSGLEREKRAQRELKLCHITSGLGNQLLHYIFKRYMEVYTGETFLLEDTFFFKKLEHNGSELRRIFPKAKLDYLSDYYSPCEFKQIANIEKKFNFFPWLLLEQEEHPVVVAERNNCFPQILKDAPSQTEIYPKCLFFPELQENQAPFLYMVGYWSHIQWFLSPKVLPLLREELTFPPMTGEVILAFKQKILESESVSLHIRRGDVMDPTLGRKWLGNGTFYPQAVAKYRKHCSEKKPTFFVFSDDIPWCRENPETLGFLPEDSVVYVEGHATKEDSFRDMELMSLCQHMILSNSSFSFVASILNRNQTQIKPFELYETLWDKVEIEPLPQSGL